MEKMQTLYKEKPQIQTQDPLPVRQYQLLRATRNFQYNCKALFSDAQVFLQYLCTHWKVSIHFYRHHF